MKGWGDMQEQSKPAQRSGIEEVWRFFSSMKLALFVLLILAVASVVGTLLPQDPQTRQPVYDIYHSFWYRGLLGLLSMNLLICSLERIKLIRKALGEPNTKISEAFVKNLKLAGTVRHKASLAETEKVWVEALAAKGYRVFADENEGKKILAADRGRFGVLGSFITHLSFLVIVLGAIYGNFTGFETYLAGVEGQTISMLSLPDIKNFDPEENFSIRINRAWEEGSTSTPGMVKDWYSDLSVIENGKEVFRKRIEVNDPLKWKGVKFYQSSFQAGLPALNFTIEDEKGQKREVTGLEGEVLPLDNNLYLNIQGYVPQFDPNQPQNPQAPNGKPAVLYQVFKNNQQIAYSYQYIGQAAQVENYKVTANGIKTVNMTGLSVRRDPGVPIVWAGSIMMVVGIFLSFMLQHRKIWVVLKQAGNTIIAEYGAQVDKNKLGLEQDLDEILTAVQERG